MAAKDSKKTKDKSSSELSALISNTVLDIPGVSSMAEVPPISGGIFISNIFGKLDIEIFINIFFGYNIPEISWNVQQSVKKALSEKTNYKPAHINVHIQGVNTDNVRKEK